MDEFIGKWRKFMIKGWENTLNEERYTPNEMSAMSIDKESSSGAFEESIPDVNTDFSVDTDFSGDLSEEEGGVNMGELAAKLQNQLGVKVIPADYDDSVVVIYPDKQPGDDLYNDRTAQKIGLVFEDGVLRLRSIFGYERGFDKLPFPAGRSGLAGFATHMPPSDRRPNVGLDDIQMLIDQLTGGLEREAKAQSDFYKDRQPD